jgi:tetrahydromethanopterin S-methyltransferase subunit G
VFQLFAWVIGIFFGSVVGALLLQLATRVVAKFNLLYSTAFVASLLGNLASNALTYVVSYIFTTSGHKMNFIGYSLMLIVIYVLYAWLLGSIISRPESGPIGFKVGSRISFLYFGMAVTIFISAIVLFRLFFNPHWM